MSNLGKKKSVDLPGGGWRAYLKDGTFVEGIKGSGEHVHYDPREGSDIPVGWKNEKTGDSINLRGKTLKELREKGLL